MSAKRLTKLSVRTIGIDAETCRLVAESDPTTELAVAKFHGFITSYSRMENDNGVYVKFNGEFEGINLINDQIFQSKSLLLYDLAADSLVDAIRNEKDEGQVGTRKSPVLFDCNRTYIAVEETVKYSETSTTNYVRGYNNLVEIEGQKSIFDELREKLPATKTKTAKLIAPKSKK